MKDNSVKIVSSWNGEKGIEVMGKGLSQIVMKDFVQMTGSLMSGDQTVIDRLLNIVDEAFTV